MVSLRYLFRTFLKIGALSFGGHMALVAVIQKIMVDKDKVVSNDTIITGISVASFLPGPLAVNVVAYIGYSLRGRKGAAVSLAGIILPSFILMLVLARAYFSYAHSIHLERIMPFTIGAVCAIILSTGLQLFRKEVARAPVRILICLAAIGASLGWKSAFTAMGLLAIGGLAGYFLERGKAGEDPGKGEGAAKAGGGRNAGSAGALAGIGVLGGAGVPGGAGKYIIGILLLFEALFLTNAWRYFSAIPLQLATVFSGMSLNLFGGGYVMIPFMQSVFVEGLHWLSQQEFVDAIAFSQVTPGPILISATFIGFKMAGLTGAVIATAAIFIPSAVLMILISKLVLQYRDRPGLVRALAGIKAAVIGLIIAAAVKMIQPAFASLWPALVTVTVFVLSYQFKTSPVYLILGAVLTGILFFVINLPI